MNKFEQKINSKYYQSCYKIKFNNLLNFKKIITFNFKL